MYGQLLVVDFTGGKRDFQLERLTEARDARAENYAQIELPGIKCCLFNYSTERFRAPKLQVVFIFASPEEAKTVLWNTEDPRGKELAGLIKDICGRYAELVDGDLSIIKQTSSATSCEFKPKDPEELILDRGDFLATLDKPWVPKVVVEEPPLPKE